MASSQDKTENLERTDLPVDDLEPNPLNPNEMGDKEFNLLYDNIEQMGVTDPILVRPHPEKEGKYRIVGGEHRWEVAKLIGYDEVPTTIITDEGFGEDQEKAQMVRHNIIHGEMSPSKFVELYNSLTQDVSNEVAADMFGFAEQEEFDKLVKSTGEQLPTEMKKEFDKGAKDIKTIDELADLLNHLFQNYGDTLDHAYMIIDFGGKESIWLRMDTKQKQAFLDIGKRCQEQNKSMDHFMEKLLKAIAVGSEDDPVEVHPDTILADCPEVSIKEDAPHQTLDYLDDL